MTFRDDMNELADSLRALQGPDVFDIVVSQLKIITRTWTGGKNGADGGYTDSTLAIPQNYPLEQISLKEIASSGGRYAEGDVRIGPITPAFSASDGATGGYSYAQLKPAAASDAVEIIYRLTGQLAGDYRLKELKADDPFGFYLVLTDRRVPAD